MCCFFFFSSRRRHTRCLSDWSSDVCSSDLAGSAPIDSALDKDVRRLVTAQPGITLQELLQDYEASADAIYFQIATGRLYRSEERRVGKECRCRMSTA